MDRDASVLVDRTERRTALADDRAWRRVGSWLRLALVALLAVVGAVSVQAQTLDEVRTLKQDDDVIARISFNATVRFLQQTPAGTATLYQISWDLVAADESVVNQSTEESRHVAPDGAVPGFDLTYSGAQGRRTRLLTLQLDAPTLVKVRQGPSSRSIDLVFVGLATPRPANAPAAETASAAPAAQPPSEPPATTATAPEVQTRATELMQRARDALTAHLVEDAIGNLNQLLLLPPNTFSQEAQELIGLAWERAGNPDRARTEYELYLKLYPEGDGAARVGQRLASLEGRAPTPAAAASAAAPIENATKVAPRSDHFTGNIAQYYYGGKARTQSLVNIAAGIDQSTLSRNTESAIVTSVDAGARYSATDSETRVVLRGTDSLNLSSDSHGQSLLNAAYIDYKRTDSGLAVRIGRQSAVGGGLLGLFDGASLSYPVSSAWKLDMMGGVPSNPLVATPDERLIAAMVEADGILDHWGGDAYVIDETTQGISNQRALGTEVRYSDELFSTYSLIDYDLLFHKFNALSLQGSIQAPAQTTITLLADVRKAPSLALTNALISAGAASLRDLLQVQTMAQVRQDALSTTALARQGLVSLSRPLGQKWQATLDLRYSEVGATPAVGDFDATPATGAQYGATLQFTGSNLYSPRDINNFNLSVLSAPTFKGEQLSYGNLTGLHGEDATIEPSLSFYTQHDNLGEHLKRTSVGLRANYRLTRRASVLGEGLVESSRTTGPLNHASTTSLFFYFGYRYELF